MLGPVPQSTSRTVDQTPPLNERERVDAFTVWAYAALSAPRGLLRKLIVYINRYNIFSLSIHKIIYIYMYFNSYTCRRNTL